MSSAAADMKTSIYGAKGQDRGFVNKEYDSDGTEGQQYKIYQSRFFLSLIRLESKVISLCHQN